MDLTKTLVLQDLVRILKDSCKIIFGTSLARFLQDRRVSSTRARSHTRTIVPGGIKYNNKNGDNNNAISYKST